MRWHKVARLVVAAIGLGCAWWVYAALRPRNVQPDSATTAVPPPLIDDTVTSTSRSGEQLALDPTTGELLRALQWEDLRVMADGRAILNQAHLTFKHNGVPYTVDAGEAETTGQAISQGEMPETVHFRNSVHMHGEDGFCVESLTATYLGAEQRINFPGEVAFTRDRLAGRGIGADLYMDRAVFWMYGQSRLTVAPQRGGVAVVATGTRIGLADADHYMRIEENARLTRRGQVLSSSSMVVHFTETAQDLRQIELEGQAVVQQTGSGTGPDMRADRITLDFTDVTSQLAHARLEGGSTVTLREEAGTTRITGTGMEMYVGADGQTLKHLRAGGPVEVALPRTGDTPARTIQAANLLAEGSDANGLERADFTGGVTYRESTPAAAGRPAASRVATARQMLFSLGGALNEVRTTSLRRTVTMKDDAVEATGDEGEYDPQAGTLRLTSTDAARLAHVTTSRIDVRAGTIDASLDGERLNAQGQVVSDLIPDNTAARADGSATGLFEQGRPIRGTADALEYSKATGTALYTGTVRLTQVGNDQNITRIEAKEVQLNEQREDLTAIGGVNSTIFVAGTPDAENQQQASRTVLTSDRLDYQGANRTAAYSGSAEMLSADGQRLQADRIVLKLFADRRALERLDATAAVKGELIATLSAGRQTTGLTLTYTSGDETYVVRGQLAQFVSRAEAKGPNVCEVFTGTELSFQRGSRVANVRNEGGAVGRARGDMKCSEVIK